MHNRTSFYHPINSVKMQSLYFDDYIQGKHVKVVYTHHWMGGEPRFLPYTPNGTILDFYLIGFSNTIDWINDIDSKIDSGIITSGLS